MKKIQTQVAIVGGGPAGMLLARLLFLRGVESAVIERQSRNYVMGRIRAGVLEQGSVDLLQRAGLGERLLKNRILQGATTMAMGDDYFLLNTDRLLGKPMTVYGQTAVTEDLYAQSAKDGGVVFHRAANVRLRGLRGARPKVSFVCNGEAVEVSANWVAGCDGFHGVCRQAIPASKRREFSYSYPFGWLGILSKTPPLPALLYAGGKDGFALCSKRTPQLSRYYVQCPAADNIADWPDRRFWKTLKARCPRDFADQITTGPSVEKSIAPLRSFICEPMRWGRLLLAGDAAHIVPPTGAKGLNLAISDARYLSRALIAQERHGKGALLDAYSQTALQRVWKVSRFSWQLTRLLHAFPQQTEWDRRMKRAEFLHLASSRKAQTAMAEIYAGLPH